MAVGLAVSAVYLGLAVPAQATAPLNQGLPWVSGSFAQGQALAASEGDWIGSQPLSLAYQWQRCTPYKDVVLADSPAAYWRLGEAVGASSAVDQASSPDNGTYTNVPTLGQAGPLSGDPDRAVRFDGAGAYVDVPDASKLKPASAFSLEAWAKTTATSGVIVDKPYAAGSTVSYSLSVASGKAKVSVNLSGGAYSVTSTASINDGNWHQVVGTFGSGTLSLYVDGASAAANVSTSGSLQYSTQKLQIGRFDASGGGYLAATVDEVALYSTALSSTQVSAHYAAGTTANGVDANCSDIAGATSSLYTPGSADLGKRLRVKVTATNSDGSASASSYATVITPAAPSNLDAPEITGSAQEGQTLTAGTGTWSGATPITFGYQWQTCSPYLATVAADAPFGYWRLAEQTGASAADSAGANGGTYTGSPALGLAGALGSDANTAAGFDGASQYVTLAQGVQFNTGNFTVEAWFKTTQATGTRRIWASGRDSTHVQRVHLAVDAGKVKADVRDSSSSITLTSVSTYSDGAWHHAVLVRSGSAFTLYVDGGQVATGTQSLGDVDAGTASTFIGKDDTGNFFGGSLDEVAAYSTALSAARVSAHYAARVAPCADIAGATSSTYALTTGEVGESVAVKVTASNAAGSASASSSSLAVIARSAPLNTSPPLIEGSPVVGQLVTANPGSWNLASSYSYQWRRCTPYTSVVNTDTPTGRWRLDEFSGTSFADVAGSNGATASGSPTLGVLGALTGDPGTGIYLNGSGEYLTLGSGVQFNTGDFTVEAWFKTTQATGTRRIWASGRDSTHVQRVHLAVDAGKVKADVKDSTNSITLTSVSTYSDGAWHHAALVRSGSTFTLYVDGGQVATGTQSLGDVDAGTASTFIGNDDTGSVFEGSLDEVAIYTTALSAGRVSAHYWSGVDPCADISGAGSSTYTLQAADVGPTTKVLVRVSATNSAGTTRADSLPIAVAASGSPVNTAAPAIAGTAAIGDQLSASPGSWTGTGTISYAYQWYRCSSYPTVVAGDAPLGYWRLGELEAATSAADSAGSNSGTYAGSATLGVTGGLAFEPDTAAAFSGGNVTLATSVQFGSANFTVEAWFKTSGGGTIWGSGQTATSTKRVKLDVESGKVSGSAWDGTSSISLSSGTGMQDDKWHHAVFTRSGSAFTLYVDGVQVATGTQSLGDVDASGASAYIGNDFNVHPFNGTIDEVAIYTSALDPTRIQAHKDSGYQACGQISGAAGQTYTPTSADRGTRLYVNVTATNGAGSTEMKSTETDTVFDAVAPDSPLEGTTVRNSTPVLKLVAPGSGGPYKYAFVVSDQEDFTTAKAASGWQTTTNTYSVPASAELEDGNFYYWRGRRLDTSSGQTTAWTAAQKFEVRFKRFGLRDTWPLWQAGPLAVNEASGNVILSLPGPSYPTLVGSMGVSLTYNSLDTTDDGLGPGWTLAGGDTSRVPVQLIDHNALGEFDAAEIVWPDGRSSYFNHVGGSNVYLAEPGDTTTLKKDGGWTLREPDGSRFTFTSSGQLKSAYVAGAQAGKGELTYTYATGSQLLTQIQDEAGRTLTLNWHAISGNCPGALLCVIGPDNVSWKYIGTGGSGTSGKFAKVNDGTRDLYQLTYGSNNKLATLKNANDLDPTNASPNYDASHAVTISYYPADPNGPNDWKKDMAQTVAEGPITGQTPTTSTWAFGYHPGVVNTSPTAQAHGSLPAGSTRQAAGYSEITPPRQYGQPTPLKTTVYYDDLDHPIETVDLLGHRSRAGYDRNDHLLWTEDQDGNPADYVYEPVTDLLLTKTDADPDGTGPLERPVAAYRYDETTIGTAAMPGPALQGLQAAYYANSDLSGSPAAEQTDPAVDFNWGQGAPAPLGDHTDNFSIRWQGLLTTTSEGDYSFSIASDGNARLVIDETNALNDTQSHPATTVTSAPVHLTAGKHKLTLEYSEYTNTAQIQLRYSCATCVPAVSDQPIPASALTPNWQNQTSVLSPAGRLGFSHYAAPWTGQPDYAEQKLVDGTPVITTYAYDSYGRTVQKVSPRGNAALTIDSAGNLNGTVDTSFATTYTYYGLTDTAAPPAFCGGGSAVNQAGLLKQQTPPATLAATYVYDSAGRAIAKTNEVGTTCTTWSSEGRLNSTKDANSHTTTYTYDPAGAVRTVTAADSTVTTTVDDESGAVKTKTDGNGHTTSFAHDAEGNTTAKTDPLSHTTTTAYDELGRKTSTTDPLNHTTTYAYDNEGRQTTTTTPRGKVTTTTYDKLGRITARTDPLNHTSSFGYDADGNQTSVTDPLGNVSSTSYDALGRVASKTDANTHTTSFGYDQDGNQTTITAADTGVTTFGYDAAGRKTSATDPLTHTTFYAYDSAGRPVSTTLPTGQTTSTAYDPVGNAISTTDAAGQTTTYTYDTVDRRISEKTPLNETTTTGYDAVGNRTSVTDPLGDATSYAYDAADRPTTTVVDPGTGNLNLTTTLAYDNADRLTTKTDPNNHTTSYAYDNDGNQTSVTGPDGSVTTLTYDDAGNLLTRRDDNTHTTTYTYDAADRLLSKTDPLGRVWTYAYDPVGNKTQVTDANGNATTGDPTDGITTYGYDAADRLTLIDYSDTTPDVTFTYDLAGRKTAMTDGAGTVGYAYDNADRMTSVTRGGTGFTYSYDPAGRLAARTYPDTTTTSYGYDNDSRPSTVTVGSATTGYIHDAAGRITATAYPNGWTEQRSYDDADRLTDIRSVKSGSSDLAVATYTRDNAGNPTQIVREGVTETYAYDTADRITAACYGGQIATCASGSKITYTYDKVGNRLSQVKFGTTTTYVYDAADELTSTTTGGNTTNYTYDAGGQQTGQGTKTFAYNLAGQLTQVANSGSTLASFTYDGAGNRLTKTANSLTTTYSWDENNGLPMLALEQQGGSTLRSYQYGDRLLSMSAGGSVYYFHHDALGTTAAITKSTGATEWTYTYDPYGVARTTTKVDPAAPDNPIQYTGELIDPETSLYNLRARTYGPADGRFLSIDPLAQDAVDPALSTYLYANAAPNVLTDRSGLRPCLDDWCPGQPPPPPWEPPPPGGGDGGGDDGGPHPSNCGGHGATCADDGSPTGPDGPGRNSTGRDETEKLNDPDGGGDPLGWCEHNTKEKRAECENAEIVLLGLPQCQASLAAYNPARCAYEFFRILGLSEVQAAAILGNLSIETGRTFDPLTQEQGFEFGIDCSQAAYFTPRCGTGILQWTDGTRQDGLLALAGCPGTGSQTPSSCPSAFDLRVQLRYIWQELSGKYHDTLNRLKAQKTLDGATRTVMCYYTVAEDGCASYKARRPADYRANLAARQNEACRLYKVESGRRICPGH